METRLGMGVWAKVYEFLSQGVGHNRLQRVWEYFSGVIGSLLLICVCISEFELPYISGLGMNESECIPFFRVYVVIFRGMFRR